MHTHWDFPRHPWLEFLEPTYLEKQIMAAIDDLNDAVSDMQAAATASDYAIHAEIAALLAALATNNTAAVEAAAQNISAVSAKMATDTAAMTASVAPPAPAPTPTPSGS